MVLIVGVGTLFAGAAAASTDRVALVLGNAAYKNVNPLKNPVNDAEAISAALGRVGFDVTLRVDGTAQQMRDAIAEFSDKARVAKVVFVYYAGHGIQIGGRNYLVPIDTKTDRKSVV